eukprot:7301371-Pyramimonas_sp.AAC.1
MRETAHARVPWINARVPWLNVTSLTWSCLLVAVGERYDGSTLRRYYDRYDGLRWTGLNWTGLDIIGLDLIGLDWTVLDLIGLDWTGLDWTGLDLIGVEWSGAGHARGHPVESGEEGGGAADGGREERAVQHRAGGRAIARGPQHQRRRHRPHLANRPASRQSDEYQTQDARVCSGYKSTEMLPPSQSCFPLVYLFTHLRIYYVRESTFGH